MSCSYSPKPVLLRSPLLRDGVRHAFTTRLGGVSTGIYASLNLGTARGDDNNAVLRNYQLLFDELDISSPKPVFSAQVHGDTIRGVTEADCLDNIFSAPNYEADALITSVPRLPLIVFTADCIPILLHAPDTPAAAAVHAGWRGTALDIAGKTVNKLRTDYGCEPGLMRAAIGPGICRRCFETHSDVPVALRKQAGPDAELFILQTHPDKFLVDLKAMNRYFLLRAGLIPENIDVINECTMCASDETRFWSHRKTGGKRGSMASIILLN